MANKRMFAETVIMSDAFLDMPASACKLYFVLSMMADDEGVVGSPKTAVIAARVAPDDLTVLIAKGFVIPLENGVVLIKHWKINNYLRKDRFHESAYKDELAAVRVKSDKSYTRKPGPKTLADAVENYVENFSPVGAGSQFQNGIIAG